MESNGETLYLITGASSAVAQEFLLRLDADLAASDQRCAVVAQYNSSLEKLTALSDKLQRVNLYPEHCDASTVEEGQRFARRIAQNYPPVDNILHTAAMRFSYTRLKDFDAEGFVRSMNVNVTFAATLASTFVPQMLKRKGHICKIVFVLSECVFGVPPKHMTSYVTVKTALLGLAKSLASDCAGRNVRVNAVSPSMMQTPFLSNIDPRIVEMTQQGSAMKRLLTPGELAPSIAFLFGHGSDWMNGANLNLTGGGAM